MNDREVDCVVGVILLDVGVIMLFVEVSFLIIDLWELRK